MGERWTVGEGVREVEGGAVEASVVEEGVKGEGSNVVVYLIQIVNALFMINFLGMKLTLDAIRRSGMSRYSSICRMISSGRSSRGDDSGADPER